MGCGSGTDRTAPRETSSQSATSQSKTDRSILLNIGLMDQSRDRLSEQFLVETPRSEHWRPGSLEGGLTTKAFEKYPVGESNTLYLYPKGEDGPQLAVPFTMKANMSSVLASSRTDITVFDDSLVVTGPAIPDERLAFKRSSNDTGP